MKTRHIISKALALAVVLGSSSTLATGLTYDPYEIYYSKYYGIGAESSTIQSSSAIQGSSTIQGKAEGMVSAEANSEEASKDSVLQHPSDDYYNTYYNMLDQPDKSKKSEPVSIEDEASMADPTNYFKW